LKRKIDKDVAALKAVAPRAGAWIETSPPAPVAWASRSPPARGRGLKRPGRARIVPAYDVAPRAGAWIETC